MRDTDDYQRRVFHVEFSDDGVARGVFDLLDPVEFSPGNGKGK